MSNDASRPEAPPKPKATAGKKARKARPKVNRRISERQDLTRRDDVATIQRLPLQYTPGSTVRVNAARLPSPEAMADMQLAYRQNFLSEAETHAIGQYYAFIIPVLASALALSMVLLAPLFPFFAGIVLGLLPIILIVLFIWLYMRRAFTLRRILVPVGFILLSLLLMLLAIPICLSYRGISSAVFGLVALILFSRVGDKPFAFYQHWLHADPTLSHAERTAKKLRKTKPNLIIVASVLAGAALAPFVFPVTAVILVISAVPAWLMVRGLMPRDAKHAINIFGTYMLYTIPDRHTPGIWHPPKGALSQTHRYEFLAAIFVFCLALATGLSLFTPWDFTAKKFIEQYRHSFFGEPFPGVREPNLAMVSTQWLTHTWYSMHFRRLDFTEEISEDEQAKLVRTVMSDTPYLPLATAFFSYFSGNRWLLWYCPIAFVLTVTIPPLILLSAYTGPLKYAAKITREIELSSKPRPNDKTTPEWQCFVDRVRTSPQQSIDPVFHKAICEADHLFFGLEPEAQIPVLVHKNMFCEHMHILGETGSGKTALGIMPVLLQLLRGSAPEQLRNGKRVGTPTTPSPMLIIDLKGDPALFHLAMHEAETRRLATDKFRYGEGKFKVFSPEVGQTSHYFNPFQSLATKTRSIPQLAQLLLDSLSLWHGEAYGRSYFSRQQRYILTTALNELARNRDDPENITFAELTNAVASAAITLGIKDPTELVSVVAALEHYTGLNGRPAEPEQAIHMGQLIENSEIAYFWLPAATESISVREIGKLALFSLLTAAIDRQRQNRPHKQIYVFIDEFQMLAGENLRVILEQTRSFGISLVLANQTMADLETHDVDLRPIVRTNTRIKQYFSITDPLEKTNLMNMSGLELALPTSYSETHSMSVEKISKASYRVNEDFKATSSWSDQLKTRLMDNDIIEMTDHPLHSIVQFSRGEGYTQFSGYPLTVRTDYPISEQAYKTLQTKHWPEQDHFPEGSTHKNENQDQPADNDRNRHAERDEDFRDFMSRQLGRIRERENFFSQGTNEDGRDGSP